MSATPSRCCDGVYDWARPVQDWSRVVAVFVQGAMWQFRDFPFKARNLDLGPRRPVFAHSPWECVARFGDLSLTQRMPQCVQGAAEGNLVSTFEHVQAFFVRYDSEPLPDFVKKWSVNTLELSKNARHSDRSIVEGFWQSIDHALQMKRSTLNF